MVIYKFLGSAQYPLSTVDLVYIGALLVDCEVWASTNRAGHGYVSCFVLVEVMA